MKNSYVISILSLVCLGAGLAGGAVLAADSGNETLLISSASVKPIFVVATSTKSAKPILTAAPCYKALTIKTKKIVKKTSTLDLNVEYPQIGQAAIDNNLASFIGQTVKNFGPGEKSEHWQDVLYIRYKISQYQDKTVSVRFYIYQFTGGAHGSEIANFRTYSLATGQRLSYSDIFKPEYDYLTALWKNAEPQVITAYKNKGVEMNVDELKWIREGAAPKFDNYRNFYLDNQGLVIYFSQYQAAYYAAGTLEVPIKYEKLAAGFSSSFNNLPEKHILCGSK